MTERFNRHEPQLCRWTADDDPFGERCGKPLSVREKREQPHRCLFHRELDLMRAANEMFAESFWVK